MKTVVDVFCYTVRAMGHVIRYRNGYVAVVVAVLLGGLSLVFLRNDAESEVPGAVSAPSEPPVISDEIANVFVDAVEDASSAEVFVAPPAPDMERMKLQGCVADGLLNGGFDGDGKAIKLVNRSECYYLHRAVETWLAPPDFGDIDENLESLRDGFLVGMFIAEAIDTKSNYRYPAEDRDFEFDEMCRSGSEGFWGEHTCKPHFGREEYRKYVRYITEQAMDRGVQVFMFGQVYLQDASDPEESRLPDVIADMRRYADYLGMEIVIGAQTNDIEDEKYLRLFDFIEGGVGIDAEGGIEDGPCFSRWWREEGDWCWALLWNDRFASKAENVFVHYDWSAKIGDDMSTLTRMDREIRHETTARLYDYFTDRDIGFLLPYVARLHRDNGGCHGPAKRYYTPDDRYDCDDEDEWNDIMSGNGHRIFTR